MGYRWTTRLLRRYAPRNDEGNDEGNDDDGDDDDDDGNHAQHLEGFVSEDKNIEFECIKDGCKEVIGFSLRQAEKDQRLLCAKCKNEYRLDRALVEKLKSFDNLVAAVKSAWDILSNTSVGVTVNQHTVKIPYRLLLTRMTTMLALKIGDQTLNLRFRVEPLKEEEIKAIQ